MGSKSKTPAQVRIARSVVSPRGRDSLGDFLILKAECKVCGKGTIHCVRYLDKPTVTEYVRKARSLLIRKNDHFIRTIGINCGCYAKCHRQIAHIGVGKK